MKLFFLVSGMAVVMVGVSPVAAQRKPAFEAADVHNSPRSAELSMRTVLRKDGRYELHNATMLDLIRTAYGVNDDNVAGGPNWLELDRFDVIAKIPSNTSPEGSNLMLQSLLAERFKLIVHSGAPSISKLALLRGDGAPKAPTPAIVVDQVNRKPTANPPDLKAKLPSLPTAFEVADIKPKDPGAQSYRPMTFSPTGRLSAPALPLRYMILLAWNLLSSEELADAPKWLTPTQPQFDVTAEVPTSVLTENNIPVPLQDLAPMFQTLLKDRLKMESHFEERLVSAYTLMAVQPRLKQAANPSARTKCRQESVPAPGSVVPDRLVTCQNITMAEFAAQLPAIAGTLYVSFPVLDGTRMDGAWDFTFTFSPIPPNPVSSANTTAAGPDALRGATPAASNPLARTSLFDALERDLGLKLDAQKRPYPLLVIDHLEEKPREN